MALFTVKLTYCVIVDADNAALAYTKACKKLKDDPGAFVSRVEAGGDTRKKRSLFGMLFLG
jgi:hypothetical protein